MSNTKFVCTLLLTTVEQSLATLPAAELAHYKAQFRGALETQSNNDTLIHGHSFKTIINSMRSALQSTASYTAIAEYKHMLWNPIVAALITTLEKSVFDFELELSSRVQNISLRDSCSLAPSRTLSVQSGSKTSKQMEKPAKQSLKPTKPSNDCPPSVQNVIKRDMLSGNKPIFRNLKHVKCANPSCQFCREMWMSLKPTKCSEIKCHVKNAKCHRDGWYVHVYPTVWAIARRDHDAGKPFLGLAAYDKTQAVEVVEDKLARSNSPTYASIVADRHSAPMDHCPTSPKRSRTADYVDDWEASVEETLAEASCTPLPGEHEEV